MAAEATAVDTAFEPALRSGRPPRRAAGAPPVPARCTWQADDSRTATVSHLTDGRPPLLRRANRSVCVRREHLARLHTRLRQQQSPEPAIFDAD